MKLDALKLSTMLSIVVKKLMITKTALNLGNQEKQRQEWIDIDRLSLKKCKMTAVDIFERNSAKIWTYPWSVHHIKPSQRIWTSRKSLLEKAIHFFKKNQHARIQFAKV
uniref:Uncharacterized protein n=1 Tax=Octopus bimaculoides TaxID=37653 RepID=A0A0L8GSC0_OCTBM